MRIPICILALVVCSSAPVRLRAAGIDDITSAAAAKIEDAATADQAAQAPADAPKPADPKPADAAPPAPPAKYGGWVFSGLADAYVTRNGNSPSMNLNGLANFDLHSGTPRFSLGKFTVDKSDKVIGIHFDVGVGETMRLIHAADPAAIDNKALRYVEQMYVIFKPNNTHGTEIDFGQFVTSAGAEVIESSSNWNYTRSLLFAWAIPYYHFGAKVATPVTKELTVGFQLINSWNTVWGQHNLTNVAFTSALTKPKYTWSMSYITGPSDQIAKAGRRNLLDTTVLFTPNAKFNAYVNFDWGRNNGVSSAYNQWYGLAGAARYQLTKIFAGAFRTEYFNDAQGFATGLKQSLKEVTVTGEAKLNDHLVGRLEFRHDASDHTFFDRGKNPASKSQNTLTLGIVALLGPLK